MALDTELAQITKERMEAAEAEQDDDEDLDDDGEQSWNPQMRSQEGYTPLISLLYSLLDAAQEIPRTLIAVNGHRPPPKQKFPKPVSALDLLEMAEERDEMHELAERFGLGPS